MYQSEKRASDPYQPARTALAESCNRSYGVERVQLPGNRRLLFKIHRNSFAGSHNSRRGYTPHQECVLKAWNPRSVVSDNGPQFSSEAYAEIAKQYQFEHVTSSPHYPQSNGEAERVVQTVKKLIKKDGDPYLAMLTYRSTPLKCGFSPSELLMSTNLRTNIPVTRESLKPSVPEPSFVREREKQLREQTQRDYNRHHGVRELEPLSPGQTVWIPDRN